MLMLKLVQLWMIVPFCILLLLVVYWKKKKSDLPKIDHDPESWSNFPSLQNDNPILSRDVIVIIHKPNVQLYCKLMNL